MGLIDIKKLQTHQTVSPLRFGKLSTQVGANELKTQPG